MAGDQDLINVTNERNAFSDMIDTVKDLILESKRGGDETVLIQDLEEVVGYVDPTV